MQNVQQKRYILRLISISNAQETNPLSMLYDACELAPGEVPADRYDPADEHTAAASTATAAELAAWEADPWF